MDDRLKKLTGKIRDEYEPVARELIDRADVNLFRELVKQDDFLFDFVKQNVSERLENACNKSNYNNLLKLMTVYSPSYEDFISSILAKYADEDLTDEILNIFENGTEDEKTYCAKFFSYIQDSLALPFLREYAFCENHFLAQNCAQTLGVFQDSESYRNAIEKLSSDDDFEQLKGVNFLISYGDKTALADLIKVMKTSGMSENIAGQIPYLMDLTKIIDNDFNSGMLVLNNIINGLGEIIPLSTAIDFNLWEIFNSLINDVQNSVSAVVLANAKSKFETLTENDEYLFDEDKKTKSEIADINNLLSDVETDYSLVNEELRADSDYVYTALEFSDNSNKIEQLLDSDNPTLILKSAETLRSLGEWNNVLEEKALLKLKDEQLRLVLVSLLN